MKILITGATGLIGSKLCLALHEQGHQLVIVTRNARKARHKFSFAAEFIEWNMQQGLYHSPLFAQLDALIHLAGESIAGERWSAQRKKDIRDSRINGSRNLVTSLKQAKRNKPLLFIGTSAVGFYGDQGDKLINEETPAGQGFLARLCEEWEHEVQAAADVHIRVVILRLGIVLAKEGGALAKLLPLFSKNCGARLGDGQQWMSWVHRDDVVAAYIFTLNNPYAEGIFNVTAPQPLKNVAFTKVMAQSLKKHAYLAIPKFVLKFALGEIATTLLFSARVYPYRLQDLGFHFIYDELGAAIRQIAQTNES